MGVNFEYYKVFYYVAKYKSITAAAQQLFLSQSTVSRIIQNLEHEMGILLFSRSRKGVSLTEAGTVLFHHISQACEHIFLGEKRVVSMREMGEGYLRIGTTEMIMKYFLLPVMESFKEKHPSIKIDISMHDPSTVGAAINSGMIDLAILTTPMDKDERIECIPWMEFEEWVLAGKKYSELKDNKYSLKQLINYPFLFMRNGTSERNYVEDVFTRELIEPEPAYEVGIMALLLDMLVNNFGLAMVPEFYAKELILDEKCLRVNIETKLPKRKICLVVKKDAIANLVTETFIETLMELK